MTRPANLIVFLSDNHAQSALGCYGNGQIHTPALDSLARNGTVFENAYCASPLCCPSRAAIATGRFPHQTGYVDNAIVYDGRVPSWMHRARDAGHEVVSVGKLHFRGSEDDNGFSEELLPMHILNGRGGTSGLLRATDDERPNTGQWALYNEDVGLGGSTYQQFDRDITRRSIEWLRSKNTEQEKPWVLFVSYVSAHPPFKVPRHLLDLYEPNELELPMFHKSDERTQHPVAAHLRRMMETQSLNNEDDLRRLTHHYYALISHLDAQIGEILSEVAALGLDNTRFIYTSDHGEMLGTQGMLGKFCCYEKSLRVPLILSGPDIEKGVRISPPASVVDLYPTILHSLGIEQSADDTDCLGQSLLAPIDPDRPLFAEYHATGTIHGTFTIRVRQFKLIYHVGNAPELFDLEVDPYESENLANLDEFDGVLTNLIGQLYAICDPHEVDQKVRESQRQKIAELGGAEAIISDGSILYSPAPGQKAETRALGD